VLSFCPLDHLCIFLFYCVRRKFSKEEVQKADSCTPRDVCQCLEIVLVVMTEQGVLASCEWRPSALPTSLHCTKHPPTTKNSQSQMSTVQDWEMLDQENSLTLSSWFQTHFSLARALRHPLAALCYGVSPSGINLQRRNIDPTEGFHWLHDSTSTIRVQWRTAGCCRRWGRDTGLQTWKEVTSGFSSFSLTPSLPPTGYLTSNANSPPKLRFKPFPLCKGNYPYAIQPPASETC
jgi:hypothetical protein